MKLPPAMLAFALSVAGCPLSAASLTDGNWRAIPATGVEMTLTQTDVIRIDFDFHGRGGYAIARRDGAIELPENFELSFRMRADAPRNTLEVKFVEGDNVWWNVRRELDYPREWRRFSVKKRNVEFAWGPKGSSPLPKRIDAIEIVITAGTGGKGTVWIDDVELSPLDTAPTGSRPRITTLPATFDHTYEIGGLIIDWEKAPLSYEIVTDHATHRVEATNGGRDIVYLPDTDTRTLAIRSEGGVVREVRALPPMRSDNDFFFAVAKESKRGDYPRYLYGEQSYWTVLGGENGEEVEALISEDGAIEAGNARFTIEPFLWIDGKLVTWSDVDVEQREGPEVVWKKHLTITPRYENGSLFVRYRSAPNARLFLAIRPFQVNPPWQFLKRTGGVVKIKSIAREGNTITVDADQRGTIIANPDAFGVTSFEAADIIEFLRAGKVPDAERASSDFISAAMTFDSHDVTITIPLPSPPPGGGEGQGEGATTRHTAPLPNPLPASGERGFILDVPAEPRIAATIHKQLQYILINRDGPSIQPGSRSYERSWIRDGSLTSAALLRLGRAREVREFLEWYANAIGENGYVPCCVSTRGAPDPVPEHDSHGQFIYLVAEYYRHTRDRAVAEAMWPVVQRVVGYIEATREPGGLMPASISHEGYSAKPVHSYWDDLFVLRGLNDAAFLAHELKKPEERSYAALRDDFRRDLVASIDATMKKHGIDYIPGSVELGDFDATSTTVAVSPVDAADALPRAALLRTFEKYWETALQPRTYTPYEHRVVGTLVRLGQSDRARALLDYFFEDQRPAAWRQWAEVVHRNPREPAFIGDMPHTWVGSDFIRSAIDFFAYESGDALILAAGVAPSWLERGARIAGLSTHYGMLSYSMKRDRVRIEDGIRVPPGGIVVVSPFDGSKTIVRDVPAEIKLKEPTNVR